MENTNIQVSDKWTRFTKELIEATDKVDTVYPVTFDAKQGKVSLIEVTTKDNKAVTIDIGSEATGDHFVINAHLVKYEWEEENPVTKTTKKREIELVNLPDVDLPTLFKTGAKFGKIWEAFRKFMIIQIMSREEINRLSIPGTGVFLADQLTNTDGISKDLDTLMRKTFNVDPNALNAMVKDYDMLKFSMGVKDKFITKVNNALISSFEALAEETKNQSNIQVVTMEKTGVEPTMAKQQDEQIRPVASVGDNRRSKGLTSVIY